MGEGHFDIYQTDAGYAAVTSPVQRQILDALREGDKQLPELVKATGRSKPTLSSLHVRELLARELVEERPHPTDSRRKVYRLRALKVGSSDLPVAQLRQAVQHYVSLSPLASRLSLGAVLDSLAAAPPGTPAAVLRAQARRLGETAGRTLSVASPRDLWMRLAGYLEAEGVAEPVSVDLRAGRVELRPLGRLAEVPAESACALLAGLVEGIAAGKGLDLRAVQAEALADAVLLRAA